MPISVIIATKNAERTIEECLNSVRSNNPAEIIVVDGNSSDGTVDIARRYTERIYSDEGKGFNHAQQIGAEHATQEYIALIDSDIILSQGSLAKLLADLKASDYVKLQATVVASSLSTYWERGTEWNLMMFRARKSFNDGLSAAIMKRDTLLKYCLDSVVQVASDYWFNMTVENEGLKIGTSSTIVYHHHTVDFKSFIKQRVRYGSGSIQYLKLYGVWHLRFWPPLARLYWVAICLIKGKPDLLPFFIVDWTAETVGMVKGFFELIGNSLRKTNS